VYASRTHSQLTQVIKELKATSYRPKVSILGSRQQLCVNPQVLKAPTQTARRNLCDAKVKERKCSYFLKVEGYDYYGLKNTKRITNERLKEETENVIRDIEDLCSLGRKQTVCPYYLMRDQETQKKADIIVMPYNYLISPNIRATLSIDWSRAVVVFDEAHNLESSCESATSYELSSEDITGCVEECDLVVEQLGDGLAQIFSDTREKMPKEDNVLRIKSFLLDFERSVDEMKIGATYPGQYAYDLMSRHHVNFETINSLLPEVDKIVSVLKGLGRYQTQDSRLQKFRKLLTFLFQNAGEDSEIARATTSLHYKIHVQAHQTLSKKRKKSSLSSSSSSSSSSRRLNFWCFCPGVAFGNLLDLGVRSAILTSGTLSPLEVTSKEFRQTFPIRLENPHIIKEHQVWVGALGKGVTSSTVNGSFKNRSTTSYKSEVGNTVANLARIVPDGLLVFFASYSMLQTCVEFWQNYKEGTIWSRIMTHKHIVELLLRV